MGVKKEEGRRASSFVGIRPTCKSFRMAREGDFDGGRVFGLSILMLLIKPETALRAGEIYVDANRKTRVVRRVATFALQRERKAGTIH